MLDLLFVAIIAIFALIGYKAGLLKALFNLISFIVAAVGAYLLYPTITALLQKTMLNTWLFDFVYKSVSEKLTNNVTVEQLNEFFIKYGVNTTLGLTEGMANGITIVILNIISVILLILVIKLALGLLKRFADFFNKIPFLGGINKILGLIVASVSGLMIIYIIIAVMLTPPSNTTEISRKLVIDIDNSFIIDKVMDFNPFLNYRSVKELENREITIDRQ